MTLMNNTKLAGSVLAVLACASFLSCSRSEDRVAVQPALQDSAITSTTETTASNTTIAADDTPKTLDTTGSVPPGAADEHGSSASSEKSSAESTTGTTTKKTKHMKHSKKAKKSAVIHSKKTPVATNQDDSYFYDSELATTDSGMIDPSQNVGAADASQDFDDTTSGTTLPPAALQETGLSPFFHEPNSRLPVQIGSGQLTGEDKSTTILEGPSLFQDPAALGRDITR